MFDKRSARDYFDDDETKTLTWIEVVRFGHLDPRPGLLLQLRDGLPTFADDGAGYHWRHQHFEVVRRLHGCKAFIIYTVQIMRKYCVLKPQRLEYLLWTCNDCSHFKFTLQFYSIVCFKTQNFIWKLRKFYEIEMSDQGSLPRMLLQWNWAKANYTTERFVFDIWSGKTFDFCVQCICMYVL